MATAECKRSQFLVMRSTDLKPVARDQRGHRTRWAGSSRWDGDWPAYGDLSALRDLFPVARRRAYLFSGGLAPAADPVRAAFDEWLERWALEPLYHRARYFEAWDAVRATLARLLGCGPESIALTDSTSRASNLAVDLVDSAEGANVVVDSTTYPSSLYPWLLKRHRGIEIRTIPTDARSADAFSEFIDHRTVAVSVSHVSALSGYRHDLRSLASIAHAHGALLIVDAAQSAGAVELDVVAADVDFLTGVGMKWLLGPPGVGYLYVAPRLLEGEPPQVSYVGAELVPGDDRGRPELLFAPGARRFEVGIGNLPGFAAFLAALRLVESVGVPAIEARIQHLAGRCIEGMKSRGLAVVTPATRPFAPAWSLWRMSEARRSRRSLRDAASTYGDIPQAGCGSIRTGSTTTMTSIDCSPAWTGSRRRWVASCCLPELRRPSVRDTDRGLSRDGPRRATGGDCPW